MKSRNENVLDLKPVVSEIQQSTRPGGPPNMSILNNLSQARLTGSTVLAGGTSAKLSSVGGNPMAMHMSSMISGGTTPSGQSSIMPMAGSTTLVGLAQVAPQSIGVTTWQLMLSLHKHQVQCNHDSRNMRKFGRRCMKIDAKLETLDV